MNYISANHDKGNLYNQEDVNQSIHIYNPDNDDGYHDDDLIHIDNSISVKYRVIKYKHFIKLFKIGKKIESRFNGNFLFHSKKLTKFSFSKELGCDIEIINKIIKGFPNVQINQLVSILNELGFNLYVVMQDKNNINKNTSFGHRLDLENLQSKLERIGMEIKKHRLAKGITLDTFAEQLGISRPTLLLLEKGALTSFLYYYLLGADLLDAELSLAVEEVETEFLQPMKRKK